MVTAQQHNTRGSMADIAALLQGADTDLVTRVLPDMPPIFSVVGAPRCGTTAISKALSKNPNISFSKPKETHFFLDDYPDLDIDGVRRLYLQRFHPDLSENSQAIGDGSVSYLYDPDALKRAMHADERVKFIASVRNPLQMMHSYHARLLFSLDEDEEHFATAWDLQEQRQAGLKIPRRCRDPRMLMYGQVGQLGRQIEQLFQVAGRDRCYVVVFDDFIAHPRTVYQQLLQFLNVADDGQAEFTPTRSNAGFKSRWLHQFAMNPPPWVFPLLKFVKPGNVSRIKGLRKRIKRINKVHKKRAPMDEAMQDKLRAYFAADVEKLSGLLDRDVTHWLKPKSTE